MNVHRLRPQPAIAVEPDEGRRLRQAGQTGLSEAQGADHGRPRWRQDIFDLQMKSKISIALLDQLFSNLRVAQDIHEISLMGDIGLHELSFMLHDLERTAEALQPG